MIYREMQQRIVWCIIIQSRDLESKLCMETKFVGVHQHQLQLSSYAPDITFGT